MTEGLKGWRGATLAIATMVGALVIKTPILAFNPSLWGEDVKVFIRGALSQGFSSVLTPANGYEELIQRLGALMVLFLPLRNVEIAFHMFSLGAICVTAAAIWSFAPIESVAGRLLACAALPFLPLNSLEIWWNLVNIQWYLAIALALIVTSPCSSDPGLRWPWLVALFLMCLSGPFSVVMAPAVAARALVLRDLWRGCRFYLVYGVATAIQAATLAVQAGGRLNAAAPSDSVRAWAQGLIINAAVGFFTTTTLFAVGSTLILALGLWWWPRTGRAVRFQVGALLLIAVAHVAASYFSFKDIPQLIGPYKLHVRYFVIPYGLGIILILSLGRGWTSYAAMALVVAVCVIGFRPFHHVDFAPPEMDRSAGAGRSPTYLASYVDLAHHVGTVEFYGRPGQHDFVMNLTDPAPEPAPVNEMLNVDDVRVDPIPVPVACDGRRTVAMTFDADLARPGTFAFNAGWGTAAPVFNPWFQQFHVVAFGVDHEAFAAPNHDIHALHLEIPNGAVVNNARLICF